MDWKNDTLTELVAVWADSTKAAISALQAFDDWFKERSINEGFEVCSGVGKAQAKHLDLPSDVAERAYTLSKAFKHAADHNPELPAVEPILTYLDAIVACEVDDSNDAWIPFLDCLRVLKEKMAVSDAVEAKRSGQPLPESDDYFRDVLVHARKIVENLLNIKAMGSTRPNVFCAPEDAASYHDYLRNAAIEIDIKNSDELIGFDGQPIHALLPYIVEAGRHRKTVHVEHALRDAALTRIDTILSVIDRRYYQNAATNETTQGNNRGQSATKEIQPVLQVDRFGNPAPEMAGDCQMRLSAPEFVRWHLNTLKPGTYKNPHHAKDQQDGSGLTQTLDNGRGPRKGMFVTDLNAIANMAIAKLPPTITRYANQLALDANLPPGNAELTLSEIEVRWRAACDCPEFAPVEQTPTQADSGDEAARPNVTKSNTIGTEDRSAGSDSKTNLVRRNAAGEGAKILADHLMEHHKVPFTEPFFADNTKQVVPSKRLAGDLKVSDGAISAAFQKHFGGRAKYNHFCDADQAGQLGFKIALMKGLVSSDELVKFASESIEQAPSDTQFRSK